jgi:predicted membrane-bound mannosyltransferase/DNA-binding beta-propeller fold protein YncE
MDHMPQSNEHKWLDQPLQSIFSLNLSKIIFIGILILAVFSRLYILGERVMSHDEVNHVYFAYQFYRGGEYVHNPITHGPLQFHLLEFSYFLFNANDFTARLPAAIFSIVSVLFIWKFKRYLGRTGAITASLLFLISPFMLYYGRYARNEAITIFFTLATTWAVLRYLDTGKDKYFYLTAAFTAFHFTTKETAFIYTAQLMLFLGLLFIYRLSHLNWNSDNRKKYFYFLLLLTTILLVAALTIQITDPASTETIEEAPPPTTNLLPLNILLIAAAGIVFLAAFITLVLGFGWARLKEERTFGMILFQLTLVLPQLAAFPAFWLNLPMTEYTNAEVIRQVSMITAGFLVLSIILGGTWKQREWLIGAGIYYAIFIVFYTSIFSNLGGIYSGIIGSLGYWLEQHGVERGSQPWYYFILVQLPLYEYLALLGTAVTGIFATIWTTKRSRDPENKVTLLEDEDTGELSPSNSQKIAIAMLLFFSLTSIFAYMVAGEKMPWLTVHISWSMWLVTGWLIGRVIKSLKWENILTPRGLLASGTILTTFLLVGYLLFMWIQPIHPFSGKELEALEVTGRFLLLILALVASLYLFFRVVKNVYFGSTRNFIFLNFFLLLAILTTRHAFLASYQNYDLANEYLVYAHSARGPKDALEQIESIDLRTTGGKGLKIGFDNHTAYPFWWYLRDYSNRLEFGENPTRDLRNYPVILVGDQNYHLVDPIVQDDFISYEFPRMIWPNQDYFNLSYYQNYFQNPETQLPMLNALFQVWLNRDFSAYAEVTGQDMSQINWNPHQSFRMYIRKDAAAQIWQYGTVAGEFDITADPYKEGKIELSPLVTLSDIGINGAKGITVSPDGSIYIADTSNHRILHLSSEYEIIHTWGSEGTAPGEFNQPWGIAVDQNGFVYVTDTWNHRIQKFTEDGEFVTTWGNYGLADSTDTFYGPRGITVDHQGNVLVTDTGNKRILVFSSQGQFVEEFGTTGYLLGQFDEPVGITISPVENKLYVADTWNQRVQVFDSSEDIGYTPSASWDIDGWYGQSLENKPFIAADNLNRIIIADPEAARILVFANDGTFLNTFGDYDLSGPTGFGLIGGVAADQNGGVWIMDSLKNELKYFIIP